MSNSNQSKIVNRADAISLLREGAVGVFPTDTVYGLVCLAHDEAAVSRLYSLKDRHRKPGTIIGSAVDQFITLGMPKRYLSAVQHFWPNPLSIVLPATPSMGYLHQGIGTLAFRIPADQSLRAFLESSGPLMTTSANSPGDITATTLSEAMEYFGEAVDFYVEGGTIKNTMGSTIIRINDDAVEVLREGPIRVSEAGEITDEL